MTRCFRVDSLWNDQIVVCRLQDGYSVECMVNALRAWHNNQGHIPFAFVFPDQSSLSPLWSMRSVLRVIRLKATHSAPLVLVNAPRSLHLLMHMAQQVHKDVWKYPNEFVFVASLSQAYDHLQISGPSGSQDSATGAQSA